MKSRLIVPLIFALAGASPGLAGTSHTTHAAQCPPTPISAVKPIGMECAILARTQFTRLPKPPVVFRLETFSTLQSARTSQTAAGAIVRAAGKIWVVSVATRGQSSNTGVLVSQIGPLSIAPARKYQLTVAEGNFGPDAFNAPHTHHGPEGWYLLTGAQCIEFDGGRIIKVSAGQSAFVPGDTPMSLTFLRRRDALFMVIGNAARPWNSLSSWKPRGLCKGTAR